MQLDYPNIKKTRGRPSQSLFCGALLTSVFFALASCAQIPEQNSQTPRPFEGTPSQAQSVNPLNTNIAENGAESGVGEERPTAQPAFHDREVIFLKMMNSPHPEESVKLKIEQMAFAYYSGLNATAQFDQLLREEIKAHRTTEQFHRHAIDQGLLPRLAATEAFYNEASAQLRYDLLRLNSLANSAQKTVPSSGEEFGRAKSILSFTQAALAKMTLADRLALNTFAEEFTSFDANSAFAKSLTSSFFIRDPEAMQRFIHRPEVVEDSKKHCAEASQALDNRLESMVITFSQYQRAQMEEPFHESSLVGRKYSVSDSRVLASMPYQALQPGHAVTSRNLPAGTVALAYTGAVHPYFTGWVTDALKEGRAPASFFLSSRDLEQAAPLIKKIAAGGFSIQSQGATGSELTQLSDGELESDLSHNISEITLQTNLAPSLVMAPFGAESTRVTKHLTAHGLKLVHSGIEALDWVDHDVERVSGRILSQAGQARAGIIALRMDLSYSALIAKKLALAFQNPQFGKRLISLQEAARVAQR